MLITKTERADENLKAEASVSEQDLRHIIEVVCYRLTAKFRFGYHDLEDMKQEAYILALEVLSTDKYDKTRSLATFLYVHIHNRLYNLKRKHYSRLTPPCARCPLSAFTKCRQDNTLAEIPNGGYCSAFSELSSCSLYASWESRNNAKRSLMAVSEGADVTQKEPREGVLETAEYLNYIEKNMPPEFFHTWKLAREGRRVNREVMERMVAWINQNVPLTY